jgi:hypothetical protein
MSIFVFIFKHGAFYSGCVVQVVHGLETYKHLDCGFESQYVDVCMCCTICTVLSCVMRFCNELYFYTVHRILPKIE